MKRIKTTVLIMATVALWWNSARNSARMYLINPYMRNGLAHKYQLGESTFPLGTLGVISFLDEISSMQQNSPRWDAAFYGVTSGAMLFAYNVS